MSTYLRTCLAMGAALVVARAEAADATTADATTEGTSSPRESPRALDGHVFQPSRLLTGPFSETSFGTATSFGAGETEAPRYNLQGNQIGTRKYTIGAFGQQLDLHLRLTPDIAIRFLVEGIIFSGINARGLLVAGATAQAGFRTGVTAGRDLSPSTRLSFVADFGLEPQYSLLVQRAVVRAIQTASFDEGGLLSRVQRLRGSPGLSFAWAPSPALGFLAEARYVWLHRVSEAEDGADARTTNGVSLGGLASFDLDPLVRFPLALQASYRADLPVNSDSVREIHQVGLGFYYSRRVRLALGLEVDWRHGDIRPGVEPTLSSDSAIATIWLRYYW